MQIEGANTGSGMGQDESSSKKVDQTLNLGELGDLVEKKITEMENELKQTSDSLGTKSSLGELIHSSSRVETLKSQHKINQAMLSLVLKHFKEVSKILNKK